MACVTNNFVWIWPVTGESPLFHNPQKISSGRIRTETPIPVMNWLRQT